MKSKSRKLDEGQLRFFDDEGAPAHAKEIRRTRTGTKSFKPRSPGGREIKQKYSAGGRSLASEATPVVRNTSFQRMKAAEKKKYADYYGAEEEEEVLTEEAHHPPTRSRSRHFDTGIERSRSMKQNSKYAPSSRFLKKKLPAVYEDRESFAREDFAMSADESEGSQAVWVTWEPSGQEAEQSEVSMSDFGSPVHYQQDDPPRTRPLFSSLKSAIKGSRTPSEDPSRSSRQSSTTETSSKRRGLLSRFSRKSSSAESIESSDRMQHRGIPVSKSMMAYDEGRDEPLDRTPRTIIAKVFKKSKSTKTGIMFRSKSDGTIVVSNIVDGGLFSTSPLEPGDEVIHINNILCNGISTKEAADIVRVAKGSVRIMVRRDPVEENPYFSVTVIKKSRKSVAGLEVETDEEGRMLVSRIHPHGLFAATTLEAGDEIISINDIDCTGLEPHELANIFSSAEGPITVEALRGGQNIDEMYTESRDPSEGVEDGIGYTEPEPEDSPYFTVIVSKNTRNAVAGLEINKDSDGRMVISRIHDHGLFASTSLQAGDEICQINGIECKGKRLRDVASLFSNAEGIITVLARRGQNDMLMIPSASIDASEQLGKDDQEGPSVVVEHLLPYISVTVTKNSKRIELGLKLKKDVRGRMVISKIQEGGLFSTAGLRTGDEIVSINSVSCKGMQLFEVADLFGDETEGAITVLAKREEVDTGRQIDSRDNSSEALEPDDENSHYFSEWKKPQDRRSYQQDGAESTYTGLTGWTGRTNDSDTTMWRVDGAGKDVCMLCWCGGGGDDDHP